MKFYLFFIIIYQFICYKLPKKGDQIWKERQKLQMIPPIINPMELDSPKLPGMGHDMIHAMEKQAADVDSNLLMPLPYAIPGYDTAMFYTQVGKALPGVAKQVLAANMKGKAEGRMEYINKMTQDIKNRATRKVNYAKDKAIFMAKSKAEEVKKLAEETARKAKQLAAEKIEDAKNSLLGIIKPPAKRSVGEKENPFLKSMAYKIDYAVDDMPFDQ